MIKYIAIVGILIGGMYLFLNKNSILTEAPSSGQAVSEIVSTSLSKNAQPGFCCGGLNCSCKGQSPSCTCTSGNDGYNDWKICSDNNTATTTKTYYKLNLRYVVVNTYGNVGNRGKVTPAKPGKYAAGTTAVLTAEPIKGFKALWDGPCETKNQNVCKIKMNSDKNVTVDFVQKPGWKCSFSILTKSLECSKEW